jgi:hypothetical protein
VVRNEGEEAWEFMLLFHTYLRVGVSLLFGNDGGMGLMKAGYREDHTERTRLRGVRRQGRQNDDYTAERRPHIVRRNRPRLHTLLRRSASHRDRERFPAI